MDPIREHKLLILENQIKILKAEYRLEQWEIQREELLEAEELSLRSLEWVETRIRHDSTRLKRLRAEVAGLEATQPQV
jgi:hypothetical protein